MPRALLTIIMALSAIGTAFAADGSHCTGSESAVFSATLQGSDSIISLCADNADAASWLQARIGKPGEPEVVFPAKKSGSLKKFTVRRYTRPQTTYLKLEFDHDGRNYAVFEFFDALSDPREGSNLRIRRISDGSDLSDTPLERASDPLSLMRLENQVTTAEFDE